MAAAVQKGIQQADKDKLQHPTIEAFKKWKTGKTDKDAEDILDSQGADKNKYPRSVNGLLHFIRDTTDQSKLDSIKAALESKAGPPP